MDLVHDINVENVYCLTTTLKFDDQLCYTKTARAEKIQCTRLPAHNSLNRWRRPLAVIGPIRPLTDFEWTVFGDIIVAPHIVADLKAQRFLGIKYNLVNYYTSTETPFGREGYELQVTGWGGYASPESGIRLTTECPICGRAEYSEVKDKERIFDKRQWDGSDFFIIWPMPRKVFVTARVRNYLLKQDYSGVKVRPLNELRFNTVGLTGFSPGHLEDWFDDDKVEEILRGR